MHLEDDVAKVLGSCMSLWPTYEAPLCLPAWMVQQT
jgi:hypothetical protein